MMPLGSQMDHGEAINLVQLENAHSRLEAILFGVPPLLLAEFEEARPRLRPPLAQGRFGLDLVNTCGASRTDDDAAVCAGIFLGAVDRSKPAFHRPGISRALPRVSIKTTS
jgi:hypothetical protein